MNIRLRSGKNVPLQKTEKSEKPIFETKKTIPFAFETEKSTFAVGKSAYDLDLHCLDIYRTRKHEDAKIKRTLQSARQDPSSALPPPPKTPPPGWILLFLRLIVRLLAYILLFSGIIGGGALTFWLYFSYGLPDIKILLAKVQTPGISVVDRKGRLLATYGNMKRLWVRAQDLPPHIVHALLSIEDRRFFKHFGLDPWGVLRAMVTNLVSGHVRQGGSTITQQLAKNLLQTAGIYGFRDRSFRRKAQEAILALELEWRFTKRQILTFYLNRICFGGRLIGLESASLWYYKRSAKDLSLYEAAVLMGLLKAPSRYSPTQNQVLSQGRARQVLTAMVQAGFISQHEKEVTCLMATLPPGPAGGSSVRYFTDWVIEKIPPLFSENQQEDLIVVTTIDTDLQEKVAAEMRDVLAIVGKKWEAGQMAAVIMKPDGEVRAMVGGTDYHRSQFNRAHQALRQAGSAFKFFTYLGALEAGLTPEDLVSDKPFQLGDWKFKNYRYREQGEITLRQAFAKSVNAAAVHLAAFVGLPELHALARRFGLTAPLPQDMTIALGSGEVTLLELTSAFASVVNYGRRASPYGILEIRTTRGGTLYRRYEKEPHILIARDVLPHMQTLMQANIKEGTGRFADLGYPLGAKTGTSQNYRDTWFVGFCPHDVIGVWTGVDGGRPMKRQPGGSPSVHLWKRLMQERIDHYRITHRGKTTLEESEDPAFEIIPPEEREVFAEGRDISEKSDLDDKVSSDSLDACSDISAPSSLSDSNLEGRGDFTPLAPTHPSGHADQTTFRRDDPEKSFYTERKPGTEGGLDKERRPETLPAPLDKDHVIEPEDICALSDLLEEQDDRLSSQTIDPVNDPPASPEPPLSQLSLNHLVQTLHDAEDEDILKSPSEEKNDQGT